MNGDALLLRLSVHIQLVGGFRVVNAVVIEIVGTTVQASVQRVVGVGLDS